MEITVQLHEDEVAFLDALSTHLGQDRSVALRHAIGDLRQELLDNGPSVLEGNGFLDSDLGWRPRMGDWLDVS